MQFDLTFFPKTVARPACAGATTPGALVTATPAIMPHAPAGFRLDTAHDKHG
ncbi:hypothetical protein [Bradyrhizobium sp. NP1]|uniref:hypothetical protein n=1 Tax=Bradyrhizobium sp. NP1 TaxID=3049772 RepID=UPI0025A54799|nr:hypothetical protein [Bradyrhizobium sp. NP1]WJR80985.1 hypothetical protein QOU61_14865 [Bradyrhizobium sp. NP1]